MAALRDYGLALAFVGAAIALEAAIDQYIADARIVTFLVPVIIMATIGGIGASLFCLALSSAAIHLFLVRPGFSLYNELLALPDIALFLVAGLSSVISIAAMRFAMERVSLQESKACLQLALDTAQLGWWQYDPSRMVGSGDARFREVFDVRGDDIPIEQFRERVHPDDANRFWADYSAMLEPAGPQRFTHEYRVQRTDGEVRWVRVSWLTRREGPERERRVVSVVGTVLDITELKLAQRSREIDEKNQQLRQANAELMAVYDQGLFVTRLNMEGRIVHANRACVEDLGFARADIIGKLFWEASWWHMPETQQWLRKAFEQAAAGTPFRGEFSFLLKDGTTLVNDIAFVPIKDKAGRVISVFVTGTDITDRARQYRATFENAGVGIAHLSPDVKWIRVNRTFARIVGYAPDELISKSVQDITFRDDLEASLEEVERLRSGKADSYELEKRYVRKDGTPVWVHLTGTAVRRNDGLVDHFVTVIQDISGRKRAEDQVRLLLQEMNHRSKNILGLVQAVARQTAVSDPEHFIDRFTDRIQAIAANQDLLVRTNWKGVDVDDLVRAQLAHFSDLIGCRIQARGPKLHLNGAAAQAIGMALHELATNASKYGALSTDAGHVDIAWNAEDDLFKMNWTERDGPPVRRPDRRGFGTTVIESMARQAVAGAVQLDYDTAGVAWRLTCPAANALERR